MAFGFIVISIELDLGMTDISSCQGECSFFLKNAVDLAVDFPVTNPDRQSLSCAEADNRLFVHPEQLQVMHI